jgi:hypothetical protein
VGSNRRPGVINPESAAAYNAFKSVNSIFSGETVVNLMIGTREERIGLPKFCDIFFSHATLFSDPDSLSILKIQTDMRRLCLDQP